LRRRVSVLSKWRIHRPRRRQAFDGGAEQGKGGLMGVPPIGHTNQPDKSTGDFYARAY